MPVKWLQRNTGALVAGARAYLQPAETSTKIIDARVKESENPPALPPPVFPGTNLFE